MGARILMLLGMMTACGDKAGSLTEPLSFAAVPEDEESGEDAQFEDTAAPAVVEDTSVSAEPGDELEPDEQGDTSALELPEDTAMSSYPSDTSASEAFVDTSATAVSEDTSASVEDVGVLAPVDSSDTSTSVDTGEMLPPTGAGDTSTSADTGELSPLRESGDTSASAEEVDVFVPVDSSDMSIPVDTGDTSAPASNGDTSAFGEPVDTMSSDGTLDVSAAGELEDTSVPSEVTDGLVGLDSGDTGTPLDSAYTLDSAPFSDPSSSDSSRAFEDTAVVEDSEAILLPADTSDPRDTAEPTEDPPAGGPEDTSVVEGAGGKPPSVDTAHDHTDTGIDTGLDTGLMDDSGSLLTDGPLVESGVDSPELDGDLDPEESGEMVDTAADTGLAVWVDTGADFSTDSGGTGGEDTARDGDSGFGSVADGAHDADTAFDGGLAVGDDSASETMDSGMLADLDTGIAPVGADGGVTPPVEDADGGAGMEIEEDTALPSLPTDDTGTETVSDTSGALIIDSGAGFYGSGSLEDSSMDGGEPDELGTGLDEHDSGGEPDTGGGGDTAFDGGSSPSVTPIDTGIDPPEEPPMVSVVAWDDAAFEGGLDPASFRFSLDRVHHEELEIGFSLVGTADLYDDFTLSCVGTCSSDSITIPVGETSILLTIEPVATPDLEVEEWLRLTLLTHAEVSHDSAPAKVSLYEHGPSNGGEYFLAPDGDDAASGDEENPFATLQHAASVLGPGDTLWVKDGVYTAPNFSEDHGLNGDQHISNGVLAAIDVSGTPDNWITISAEHDGNDERPVFRFDGSGGIQFRSGASHIRLEGLEVEGPAASIQYDWAHEHRWSKENFYIGRGIFSWGPVHHIVVKDCHVHHTPGSGIRFNSSDYIRVEGNTVSNTTWWSSSAESAIVIATSVSIDEEDAVKFLYANNRVYNNWNVMEFCNRPLEGSTEDEYGNCDHYTGGIIDGQGLYVTRNNETYLYGRMRFENNIAYNNGFGGVVYHKTDRGELFNNLIFMNGAYPGLTNYSGLSVNTVNGLVIANNVIWARENDDYALKNNGGAIGVVAQNNVIIGKSQFGEDHFNHTLSYEDADVADFFATVADIDLAHPQPLATDGALSPAAIGDWIDALIGDVRPPHNAPFLVDQGTLLGAPATDMDGVHRPQGLAVDVGPFEQVEIE